MPKHGEIERDPGSFPNGTLHEIFTESLHRTCCKGLGPPRVQKSSHHGVLIA